VSYPPKRLPATFLATDQDREPRGGSVLAWRLRSEPSGVMPSAADDEVGRSLMVERADRELRNLEADHSGSSAPPKPYNSPACNYKENLYIPP
jgi:hypothetical protein